MRMLHLLTILVAAGCGEKNEPEPLSKTKSPLSEKVQHANQDSKAKVRTPIWEFETGGDVFSSPAIGSDGTVYFGSLDNKLYALNGKTGVKIWEFETGGWIRSSPPLALMARFTSGHMTTSSMPSMVRLGSSYGNLKREVL